MTASNDNADTNELVRLRARVADLEQQLAAAKLAPEGRDLAWWQSVVRAAPDFITVFDDQLRFVYINTFTPDYPASDLNGYSLFDIIAPECHDDARAALQSTLATGVPTRYEAFELQQQRWYDCHVGRILLPDGRRQAVVVSHNIDARRSTERALQEARTLWDSLIANSPDIVMLLDRDGKIHLINHTAAGFSREEVESGYGQDFVLPEYREPLVSAIRQAIDSGQPQHIELQDTAAQRWWWVTLVPVMNSARGELVLAISGDITERRRAEDSLRESEAHMRLLFQQVPALVWTISSDEHILSIDGTGLTALGITPESWRGKTLQEYFGDSEAGLQSMGAHRVALLGNSAAYEQRIAGRDFQKHVEPLRDAHGNIIGAIGVAIDVTPRRESEREVRRTNDELEARVAERTCELDKLNQSLREDIAKRQQAEAALRESEERFRIIAETVPVAVVITRVSDGLLMFANQRAGALVGLPHEQVLGRRSSEFYADPEQRLAIVAQLGPGAEAVEDVITLVRSDDTRVKVSVSYQPIVFMGEQAILTGFVDITKRIETEEALRGERRLLKRLLDLHERDRQLISYEIHDGVVQDMTAALMFLEASRPTDASPSDPAAEAFVNGVRLLRGSIHEARRLINGLQPPVLEDAGVIPAVEALIEEMKDNAGLDVEFVNDVRFERLAPALEIAIYRIVQEGLNNVWHHSRSPHARVELLQRDDAIQIVVQDWGIGFEPTKVAKRRYGLMGVRERARLLNGRAVIDTKLGEGTRLYVELPLVDALMTVD